jgi:hypothetical protein
LTSNLLELKDRVLTMAATDLAQAPSTAQSHYSSLTSFYDDDERRVRSRELDVGLWWRDGSDGPLHRAAWVFDTGELYLVRLGPLEEGGGQVEVLGRVSERERLEHVLAGWRERCGEPRSLAWLRERASALGTRARRGALGARVVPAGRRLAPAADAAPVRLLWS